VIPHREDLAGGLRGQRRQPIGPTWSSAPAAPKRPVSRCLHVRPSSARL